MLFSDNQSAITLSKGHQYHAHTKHINICLFPLHPLDYQIQPIYCPTADMITDILTKALPSLKVKHLLSNSDSMMLEGECWNSNCPRVFHHHPIPFLSLRAIVLFPYSLIFLTYYYHTHPLYFYCPYYSHLTERSFIIISFYALYMLYFCNFTSDIVTTLSVTLRYLSTY